MRARQPEPEPEPELEASWRESLHFDQVLRRAHGAAAEQLGALVGLAGGVAVAPGVAPAAERAVAGMAAGVAAHAGPVAAGRPAVGPPTRAEAEAEVEVGLPSRLLVVANSSHSSSAGHGLARDAW